MTPRASSVYLLWGEDDFLLREAAFEVLGDLQPRELDAGTWQGGELADLATPSLFGERRALLVNDCRSLPEEATTELAAYLTASDPDAPLVLLARVGDRAKAPAVLVKLVQPVGTCATSRPGSGPRLLQESATNETLWFGLGLSAGYTFQL